MKSLRRSDSGSRLVAGVDIGGPPRRARHDRGERPERQAVPAAASSGTFSTAMFRARSTRETPSRSSAARGSVGSARVWDERTRAQHKERPPETQAAPETLAELTPGELAALVQGIVQVT